MVIYVRNLTVFVTACAVLGCGIDLQADDFAIRTHIFEAGRPKAVAENLTVFQDGLVYDFALTAPKRVTLFDRDAGLFRLTDPEAQTQTTLTVDELLQFVATEQARASESDNPLVRFAAQPTFTEQFDASSSRLSLHSPTWDYDVETIPAPRPEVLRKYLLFAHWFTHLNAVFRPLPPGVRLHLNERLSHYERLPVRVVARIKRDGKLIVEQESRHEILWTLSEREERLIQQWKKRQPEYRPLAFREYYRALH